jgi:hypothetical protein
MEMAGTPYSFCCCSDHDDSLHASLSLRGTLWTLPRTEQPRRPPTNAVHAAVTTATSDTSRLHSGSSRRHLHSPTHATTSETHAATTSTRPVNANSHAKSRRFIEHHAGRSDRSFSWPLSCAPTWSSLQNGVRTPLTPRHRLPCPICACLRLPSLFVHPERHGPELLVYKRLRTPPCTPLATTFLFFPPLHPLVTPQLRREAQPPLVQRVRRRKPLRCGDDCRSSVPS